MHLEVFLQAFQHRICSPSQLDGGTAVGQTAKTEHTLASNENYYDQGLEDSMKIQDYRGQPYTHSPCRRERSQLDINPGKESEGIGVCSLEMVY